MTTQTYAIEYFSPDSSGSQWETVQASGIREAVAKFKEGNALARVYAVFIEHHSSDYFYEEYK
jgi:hypothetical protein